MRHQAVLTRFTAIGIGLAVTIAVHGCSSAPQEAASTNDCDSLACGDGARLDAAPSDGDADVASDASGPGETSMDASAACPEGRGPAMVRVTGTQTSFCIDTTEVTANQYREFVVSGSVTMPEPDCEWNTSYMPATDDPVADCARLTTGALIDSRPMTCVDWCDADAFCRWAGKRLCGREGGGSLARDAGATDSEWVAACSANGANAWPYGNSFIPGACVGNESDGVLGYNPVSDKVQPGGSSAKCRGSGAPYSAIYDLSGNAAEWVGSCSSGLGEWDRCASAGGSIGEYSLYNLCRQSDTVRGGRAPSLGFRCCAD